VARARPRRIGNVSGAVKEAMQTLIVRLVRETEGQDLVEYAFLTGCLALGMIASFNALQVHLAGVFTRVRGILLGWS